VREAPLKAPELAARRLGALACGLSLRRVVATREAVVQRVDVTHQADVDSRVWAVQDVATLAVVTELERAVGVAYGEAELWNHLHPKLRREDRHHAEVGRIFL